MKRILLLALTLTMLMTAALAESSLSYTLACFELTVPEDVTVEEYDASMTVVRDQTRIVVQVIPQELSEDGQEQIRGLMPIYNENMADVTDMAVIEGVYGAMGLIEDRFGEGIDEVPVLLLTDGKLLILSGYDFDGDTQAVRTLLTELLSGLTLNGEPVLPAAATEDE